MVRLLNNLLNVEHRSFHKSPNNDLFRFTATEIHTVEAWQLFYVRKKYRIHRAVIKIE